MLKIYFIFPCSLSLSYSLLSLSFSPFLSPSLPHSLNLGLPFPLSSLFCLNMNDQRARRLPRHAKAKTGSGQSDREPGKVCIAYANNLAYFLAIHCWWQFSSLFGFFRLGFRPKGPRGTIFREAMAQLVKCVCMPCKRVRGPGLDSSFVLMFSSPLRPEVIIWN